MPDHIRHSPARIVGIIALFFVCVRQACLFIYAVTGNFDSFQSSGVISRTSVDVPGTGIAKTRSVTGFSLD